VLQSPFDHFFAQGGRVLFYSKSGREFVFQASVGVDLVSNIVVKAQNAFVVQINNSHELSPIRDYLLLAFSPSSTRRRMASDSVGMSGCLSAHRTIAARITGSARKPIIGVIPVAGRPADFCLADIAFFINFCLA
jgi:hypothetical protein